MHINVLFYSYFRLFICIYFYTILLIFIIFFTKQVVNLFYAALFYSEYSPIPPQEQAGLIGIHYDFTE